MPGRGALALAVFSGLSLTGGASYFYVDVQDMFSHAVTVSERSSRIVVAAAQCFDDYRTTLNKTYVNAAEQQTALSACHQRCADRTYKVLSANAGVYIKLGQHLSALQYLLPPEWTETFVPLQDQCPVSSLESIRQMVQDDMGQSLDELFSEFEPEPLGTASLAQVHRAVLRATGETVAVKLQHPSLAEYIPLDVKLTGLVFKAMDRFFPEYPMTWLYEELDSSIFVELDFRNEARNAERTAAYFRDMKGTTALRVPRVMWAEPRILVMEYIAGARPDDVAFLDRHGISRNQVSVCLSHIFNTMIFAPGGYIHCDPHGGNLAIRAVPRAERGPWWRRGHNFEIVLYDHGLYREVPTALRRDYAKFWLAVVDGDLAGMRAHARAFGGITEAQFPLFASAITGRNWSDVERDPAVLRQRRSPDEMKRMSAALKDGLVPGLMQMLAGLPRVVLLLLKTNDLTRALDEGLHTTLGPERTFLIMARYCALTVYDEDRERAAALPAWHPRRAVAELAAAARYGRERARIGFADWLFWFQGLLTI
ncbi:ABC1 family-domain-containing protein [Dipodascopsis tothii]|uniref:ABC1 family-domain-containing protein n=1 Tax=Dipodascopsis tothii TaxID=44089 RepID=UPI0034CF2389